MRSDARRNRERVLVAAEDVFSEMGLRAQIEEVARRAGVGVGTVCRHFPTKQALVEAVLEAMYESLLARRRGARSTQPDPGAAFETFFVALSEFQARHRALAEHMANEIDLPASAQPVRDALRGAIGELVARAQARGRDPRRHRARPTSRCCSPASRTRPRSRATSSPCCASATSRSSSTGCARSRPATFPGRPLDFAQLRRLKQRRAK